MPIALNTSDPLFSHLTYLFAVDDDNSVKEFVALLSVTLDPGVLLPNSTPAGSSTTPYGRSFRTSGAIGGYSANAGVSFAGASTNVSGPVSIFLVLNRYLGSGGTAASDLVAGSGPLIRVNPTNRFSTAVYPGVPVSGAFTAASVPSGGSSLCITRNGALPSSVFAYLNGTLDNNFTGGLDNASGQFGPVSGAMAISRFGGFNGQGWTAADFVFCAVFVGYQLTGADVARLHASLYGNNAFALIQSPNLTFNGVVSNKSGILGSVFSWGSGALASFFSGGALPLSYSISGGALPDGLSLNPTTGVVSGIPALIGTSSTTFRATDVGSVTADSNAVTFTISAAPPPSITGQPSSLTVVAPATATFSVTASGLGLAYQWQQNGVDIFGATSASYTTPPTSVSGGMANSGDAYRCVVSNASGSTASSVATLTVNPAADTTPPSLTGSITADAIAATGYTLTWPIASDNVAVTGYEVSLNGGANWADAGNFLSTAISGRAPGTTDAVRVRAYDAAGNRSAPALAIAVTLLGSGSTATLTSQPFKNAAGSLLANTLVHRAALLRLSDMVNVLTLSNLTTDALGALTISNASLAPGVVYLLVTANADGSAFGCQPYTAA